MIGKWKYTHTAVTDLNDRILTAPGSEVRAFYSSNCIKRL
jgi:hypothetical protein